MSSGEPQRHSQATAEARRLAFLERLVRATAERSDHIALLQTIIDDTTEATGTQVCSLYLWDEIHKQLVLTATNGLSQSGVGKIRLGLGEGVTGWVAAYRQPLMVPDVRADPRFVWVPNLDQERYTSMLSVPIISHQRVVGVMNLQTVDIHAFTAGEVEFVQALAAQVAGIIELSVLRQELADQLAIERASVARLTALNTGKSDLLAMLSHDFRGPLSVAKTYIHGLMSRLDGLDLEACREADLELQSLERMTDNLMLSLELESQHQLVLDLEHFDLVALLGEATRGLQRTSLEHSILVESTDARLGVTADRAKIRSVIVNLVGNALKYSPSGGRVWVRVQPLPDTIEVSVQDEGIGLDARDAETIFERYGRGGTALESGIRGHGLGLFICRRIIEGHQGSLYARPMTTGSCFTFTLPRLP
jgi:signal transduction histidine kinase